MSGEISLAAIEPSLSSCGDGVSYCGCRIVLSVLILPKSSESLGGWAERLPLCGRGLLVGEAGGEAGFGR